MNAQRPIRDPVEVWRRYDAMEVRLTAPLTERMLDLARVGPGMRVLDLATGRGEPAISAAHRVGPSGHVLGVDVSASMLDMARERAAREGVTNLELRAMSAEALEGMPATLFDVTLVRWGLMYMDAPVAALAHAREAMVPHGALVLAVWAVPERATFFTLPRRVLEKHRALPPIPRDSPGTFRYADTEHLRRDLESAGFQLDHFEDLELPVMEAETGADLIDWVRAFGLTRLLNDLPEHAQRTWEEDLVKEAEPLRRNGMFRLGGVTRIVVASRAASSMSLRSP